MRASTHRQRVAALGRDGYRRYDESTATRLGRMSEHLLADYGGDLRRLRAAGHAEPAALSRLLRAFPGIGPAGAQIFLREVQGIWSLPPVFDRPPSGKISSGTPRSRRDREDPDRFPSELRSTANALKKRVVSHFRHATSKK